MRRHTIIAQFGRVGVTVLGGTVFTLSMLATLTHASPAEAAPAAAAPATGPDAATKKAAREAYAAGEKAYAAADYKAAYDSFKKAFDLIPSIHAEYWMAMAMSQDSSQVGAAYDALSNVITSPDSGKLGEEKTNAATARLAELKKAPSTLIVTTTPPGAELSVDGTSQPGVTPSTVSVPAGTHHLALGLKGYDVYETDVTLKPGQKFEQKLELNKSTAAEPVPAAAPAAAPAKTEEAPPPAAKEERSLIPAYVTLGVGVVGAGVGTIFGIQALSAKSDFDKNPTNANADKAERNALIADMGFAVALTLGITGIVLLTTGDDTPSEVSAHQTHVKHPVRARLDVAPVMTPTTQGAAARFIF